MSEQVKKCYTIDDDIKAMECVKDVIKNDNSGCKPRIVLLYKDGCAGCAESKEHYKNEIADGIVTPISIVTQEGASIAARNDITAVPAVLILDCHNIAIV